jgi:hypothetical protein
MKINSNRREFLASAGTAAVAVSAACLAPAAQEAAANTTGDHRATLGRQIRNRAALANAGMPIPAKRPNQDEQSYPSQIGSYHKGLPHDETGEVDPRAYRALLRALESGRPADFEKIPLGGNIKLSNPQGGLAFDLEACDPHQTFMATPPALASAWRAGEMVEDYWMALLRDVNFADYPTNAAAASATAELNRLSDFHGPKHKNLVTPQTLFRGCTPGDLVGPYVSQFLLQPFRFGALHVNQQYSTYAPDLDYMADADGQMRGQRTNAGTDGTDPNSRTRDWN